MNKKAMISIEIILFIVIIGGLYFGLQYVQMKQNLSIAETKLNQKTDVVFVDREVIVEVEPETVYTIPTDKTTCNIAMEERNFPYNYWSITGLVEHCPENGEGFCAMTGKGNLIETLALTDECCLIRCDI